MNPRILADLGDVFSSASIAYAADGSLVIQSAPARYVAWVAALSVMLVVSLWCWRRRIGGHFAPGVFFASFLIPVIVIPSMATERVRITPDSISIRTGFWFSPADRRISLVDVDAIIEASERVEQRVFDRGDTVWDVRYRSAKAPQRIKLSDLLESNRGVVAEFLQKHGVRILKI